MSLTVLTGLPGSGKSKRLIEWVNAARAAGQPVITLASAEAPWLRQRASVSQQRILGCRVPGLICPLTHFVTAPEATDAASAPKAINSRTVAASMMVHDRTERNLIHSDRMTRRCVTASPELTELDDAVDCSAAGPAVFSTMAIRLRSDRRPGRRAAHVPGSRRRPG